MTFRQTALCAAFLFALAPATSAQTALAPWFDFDGFYNRSGVELTRATNDMTACRVEASRLKVVRNTNTRVNSGPAFNATGAYDPVVAGAAYGIASIMFAIQDANYNGSIEQIEFRDCAVALGYRHYRLGKSDRERFNAEADHGFATLVAAQAPADGRLNEGEVERNYFSAELAESAYQNAPVEAAPPPPPVLAAVEPTPEAAPITEPASTEAQSATTEDVAVETTAPPAPTPPTGIIARLAPGEVATAQPGMAIVVVAASQRSGATTIPWAGETFQFKRVTADGAFLDLLQPTASFAVRSHFNPQRRRDPTLAGAFTAPRYSTYVIPAGRYVLSGMGALNTCLSTITFDVGEGDVAYLGDLVLRPQGIPMGSMLNPIGNLNSGMDNRMRADLRIGIADNLEAARAALQADEETKARLERVAYQNGYRIPCDGSYIGRVANPAWSTFSDTQPAALHDAMAERVAAAQAQ